MNTPTFEAITRHGETLLRAFPHATDKNPVTLCKKLRRIENAVARPILDYANGDSGVTLEHVDAACESAIRRLSAVLGLNQPATAPEEPSMGIFINRDPRGYALKIGDEWTLEFNRKQYELKLPALHTDMGGYGIIAPDLTVEKEQPRHDHSSFEHCCPVCGLAPKLPRNAETGWGFEKGSKVQLFNQVQALGIQYNSHETDLYLPVNEQTQKLIDAYEFKSNVTKFISQIDGKPWFDIPFAYLPAWHKKVKAT